MSFANKIDPGILRTENESRFKMTVQFNQIYLIVILDPPNFFKLRPQKPLNTNFQVNLINFQGPP